MSTTIIMVIQISAIKVVIQTISNTSSSTNRKIIINSINRTINSNTTSNTLNRTNSSAASTATTNRRSKANSTLVWQTCWLIFTMAKTLTSTRTTTPLSFKYWTSRKWPASRVIKKWMQRSLQSCSSQKLRALWEQSKINCMKMQRKIVLCMSCSNSNLRWSRISRIKERTYSKRLCSLRPRIIVASSKLNLMKYYLQLETISICSRTILTSWKICGFSY